MQLVVIVTKVLKMKESICPLQEKCHQYWPDKVDTSEQYGSLVVTLRDFKPFADYDIKTLSVKNVSPLTQHLFLIIK